MVENSSVVHAENKILPRNEWPLFVGLFLTALVIRILMFRFHPMITGDGVWYALLGQHLIAGNLAQGLSTYWPPLYPLLIGLCSLIFNDLEFAGRVVSLIAGSLLTMPVYLLCRDFYDKKVATIAVGLIIIHPVLISYSTFLLSESLYTLLLFTAITTGWYAVSRGKNILFLSVGLLLGACYLIRPEAIGYILLIPVTTICINLIRGKFQLKKVLFNSLSALIGFMLISSPYLIYLYKETGKLTISEKLTAINVSSVIDGKDRWRGLIEDGQTTLADKAWAGLRSPINTPDASVSVRTNINWQSFRPSLSRIRSYLRGLPEIISFLILFLSCLGIFKTSWTRERAIKESYLFLFLLSTLVGYSCTPMFEYRYLIPFIPLFLCWSSKGVWELENWVADSIKQIYRANIYRNIHMVIRVLILVGLLLFYLLPANLALVQKSAWDAKSIAHEIKSRSAHPLTIMSTDPWPAFYAGGKHLYIPNEEYSTIVDYARRKKVDYLVVQKDRIDVTPHLSFLFDDYNQQSDLRLVQEYNESPRIKVLVFELTSPPNLPE